MSCSKCGGYVDIVDTDSWSTGKFSEEYECVTGHKGYIRGDESSPPSEWTRYGEAFE